MEYNEVVLDSFAGTLKSKVDDYLNKQNNVNYKIHQNILDYILKHEDIENIEEEWIYKICNCENINDLPDELKELANQFLPEFFNLFPEYKNSPLFKG